MGCGQDEADYDKIDLHYGHDRWRSGTHTTRCVAISSVSDTTFCIFQMTTNEAEFE